MQPLSGVRPRKAPSSTSRVFVVKAGSRTALLVFGGPPLCSHRGIRGTQSWFPGDRPRGSDLGPACCAVRRSAPTAPQLGRQTWDPASRSSCLEVGVRVPRSSHFWSVEGEASVYMGWGSTSRPVCLASAFPVALVGDHGSVVGGDISVATAEPAVPKPSPSFPQNITASACGEEGFPREDRMSQGMVTLSRSGLVGTE